MKYLLFAICIFFVVAGCNKNSGGQSTIIIPPPVTDTVPNVQFRSADLSFLPEIQQAGTQFYDSTGVKAPLDIFKEYGCNLVRVRLWYNPVSAHSGLDEVLAFCKQIQQDGLQILLDFHYSDTWADPGHQSTPAAWAGLSLSVLEDSVTAYTQRVIGLLKAQNTLPAIVQIGNEINAGMLWPLGAVSGTADTNWINCANLVKSGIAGVKAADTDNKISIMLHYAELDGASAFFTNMTNYGVQFDVVGLSYYPWWSESDTNYLANQLNQLAVTFNKKIFIAETAYPFTLLWNDNTNNVIGEPSQLAPGYNATPQGQLQFLTKLRTILAGLPYKSGIGFSYWAPDWVAFKGPTATDGSDWENLTLFDFSNKALPGLKAYGKLTK